MANEAALADQKLSTFSAGGFSLGVRRDGRSDVWCATWYDAAHRTLRHRSLRTRDENEARRRLQEFAAANGHLPSRVSVRRSPPMLVYFIGGDYGGIKIGIAGNVERRLVTLQCGSPIPLRVLASCEGGRSKETEYHKRFASHRLHSEWFAPHPDILAEIDRLNQDATGRAFVGGAA